MTEFECGYASLILGNLAIYTVQIYQHFKETLFNNQHRFNSNLHGTK